MKSILLTTIAFLIVFSINAQTTVEYTASGTWTCPVGVTSATVEVWGAGGGGGGSINTNGNAGGGGGGGAYVKKTITVAAGNYTITIGTAGTGGASGANGTAGGNSIFGSNLVIANGGSFGFFGTNGAGGAGGIASGGDVNYNGGNGAAGVNGTASGGGGGGAGTTGAGGNASGSTAGLGKTLYGGNGGAGVSGSAVGLPGSIYGGGGSGGYGKGKAGGNGAAGYIRVTYTLAVPLCPSSTSIAPTGAQTKCVGDAGTQLTATVTTSGSTGTPTILYQWYYNTTNSNSVAGATLISGATAQTYTPATTVASTRWYFCVGYATDNGCAQTNATQSLASNAVQVTVNAAPVAPTSVSASANPICAGNSTTLSYTGGSGTTFAWYTGSCGGTPVGTGNNLSVSPGSTTTYYGRWETASCGNSACQTVTVTVNPLAVAPTSVTASVNPICSGNSTSLSYTGGSGTTFRWYTGSCGGTLVGSGNNLSVSPTTTTTYYGGWENGCGLSSCQTVTVTVNTVPTAGPISGPVSVSAGTPGLVYSITPIAGATNYTWTKPGNPGQWTITAGQGTSSITVTSGTNSGEYITVFVTNACGDGPVSQLQVFIGSTPNCPSSTTIAPATAQNKCVGDAGTQLTATITTSGGSGTPTSLYQWYYNTTNSNTVAGATLISAATAQTYTPSTAVVSTRWYFCVGYATDNGCAQTNATQSLASNAVQVTVNNVPATPGLISGPGTVAPTSAASYSIAAVAGAISYTWSVPANWTINSGQSTTSINVTSGNLGDNGNITVTATNLCGTSAASILPVICGNVTNHSNVNCNGCHLFHNAPGVTLTSANGNGLLCQSCHVSGGTAQNKPLPDSDMSNIGLGTGNSHAWGLAAVNVAMGAVLPTNAEMLLRTEGSTTIICSTCHDQHNGAVASPHLRADNTNDAICKDCHSVRDVGKYTNDPVNNRGSHPININYNNADPRFVNTQTLVANGQTILCSTCHSVHDVNDTYAGVSDGNLLRMANDASICEDCHVPMSHNGMSCRVCHDTHDPNKTNIYMIKSPITTPNSGSKAVIFTAETGVNSFADGDANYNGICEVCHTNTSHYRNDGLASDQSHTSQGGQDGQNCTGCHPHGNNFSAAGGTCTGCHSTARAPVSRSGAAQIVGAGGEFEPSPLTSRHTAVAPTNTDCENCHYSAAGHPTNQKQLRNVDLVDTEWLGDVDVYCLKCHDGTPPAGITFSAAVTDPDKSGYNLAINHNCLGCHERHGSTFADLLKQSPNYTLCRTCHDGGAAVNIDAANIATPGAPGTGNTHAWGVSASSGLYQTNAPTNPIMSARLDGGNMVCKTCHDPHNSNSKFTVIDNSADAMCKDCHSARNVLRYTDAPSGVGSHPVGVTYSGTGNVKPGPTGSVVTVGGKVECSSCHKTHNSTSTDGNLLRQTNNATLCTDCHTYSSHQGQDCKVCHDSHGTGTNIYLVKNTVITPSSGNKAVVFSSLTGANSFADGNVTYNGICEVCHTTTKHHKNTDDGHAHQDGTNCTTSFCHTHTNNFGKPTCSTCHSSPPYSTALQIFGAGGQFDGTSTHNGGVAPANSDCESCHYPVNGALAHMGGTIILKDPDAAAAYSAADRDVWCVKCHDATPPADMPVGTKYNKSSFIGTPHDYLTNSCAQCHSPHESANADLLTVAGNYNLCRTCHDGAPGTNIDILNKAVINVSGTSHAWDRAAVNATAEAVNPTNATMLARLSGGNVVCNTCHDPHNNTNGKFTVIANNTNQMCKDCHSARNRGRYIDNTATNKGTHPIGVTLTVGTNYKNPTTNILLGGKVECMSCHKPHNAATNDGNLLRMTNNSTLCKDCHLYKDHFGGMTCLNCHTVHNTNKTNIYMINSPIATPNSGSKTVVFTTETGPNSFADGDATYNGICEVCHTTTGHHRNNGSDGTSHNDGTKCTGCHSHSDGTNSFPNSSCHSCHERTGTEPQLYPATGAHEKHAGALYAFKCSECHFGKGLGGATEASHPDDATPDVVFNPNGLARRNGLDSNTPTYNSVTKTCSNVYCHSSGNTADRGNDGTYTWGSAYPGLMAYRTIPAWNSTTNVTCGSATTDCHNGPGGVEALPNYIITTANFGSQSYNPPNVGKHVSSAHLSNSQNLSGNGWGQVTCFWCHETDDVSPAGNKKMGTYGTAFHVDGQTHFKPTWHSNGGTMVNTLTYSFEGSAGHCGKGKTCW